MTYLLKFRLRKNFAVLVQNGWLKMSTWYRTVSLCHQYSAKYKDTCYTTKITVIYFFSFLASGDSYKTLAGCFRRAPCSISVIVTRTCDAIWTELVNKVMPEPKQADWEAIETGFRLRWNFPNCCGAIDGKHVAVRQPPGSGSLYYNYKNYFSIVLMAVVDAGYRFVMVDIGNYGSNSDTGILKHSIIGQCHIQDDLGLPPRKMLPGYPAAGLMPHVFVGDEAFGIAPNIMRPYPQGQRGTKMAEDQLVFNYRYSQARRIVECTFGILVQRFRVFDRRMCNRGKLDWALFRLSSCSTNSLLTQVSSSISNIKIQSRVSSSQTCAISLKGG